MVKESGNYPVNGVQAYIPRRAEISKEVIRVDICVRHISLNIYIYAYTCILG